MAKHSEDLYKKLADKYVDAYGEVLRRENAVLDQYPPPLTARMDRRVKTAAFNGKRLRLIRGFSALAACVALLMLFSRPWELGGDITGKPMPSAAESSAATADTLGGEAPAADGMTEDGAAEPALIPLAFSLPENLTVCAAEQDRGQSIYYLADIWRDDVVMTLEYADTVSNREALTEIDIGGATAYGASTGDYNLLTFQRDGVLYTLTCKHDVNTLVSLSRYIL